MISLELQAVETENVKSQQRVRDGPALLQNLLNALRKKFKEFKKETNAKNIDNMLRSKREIFLARKQKSFDEFSEEIESLMIGMVDGRFTAITFHQRKHVYFALMNRFLQREESALATQKDKLTLRLTGFARSIVDDLHEKSDGIQLKRMHNLAVYKLQHSAKMVLSAHNWPKLSFLHDALNVMNEPIVLLNALRFLEVICSKCVSKGKVHEPALLSSVIISFRTAISVSFVSLRDWSKGTALTVTLLSEVMKSLSSLLGMRLKTDFVDHPPPHHQPGAHSKAKHDSVSSTGPSTSSLWEYGHGDYSDKNLYGDLILWLRAFEAISSASPLSEETVFCSSVDGARFCDEFASCSGLLVRDLSGALAMGSALRTDALHCCIALTHLHLSSSNSSSHPAMTAVCQELLACSLLVAMQSAERLAARLGPVDSPFTFAVGDIAFLRSLDEECVAAFHCAANAFALGRPTAAALSILNSGHIICRHRLHSFFVVSAWLKCILAAALFSLSKQSFESSHQQPLKGSTRDAMLSRKELVAALSVCTFRVMVLMCVHRYSMSLLHMGMLALRVLFRDAFQLRHIVEEYCERSLLAYAQPLSDFSMSNIHDEESKANEEFERAAAAGTGGNDQKENGEEVEKDEQGNSSSSSGGGGGGNERSRKEKLSELQLWKKEHLSSIMAGGQVAHTNFKFADLLHFIGETHLQSGEVVEQLLLLIDHISFQSQLCKYLIIDTGMPLLLQRILAMYSADIYITALTELCISLLDV